MLAIGRALLGNPKFLMLDEPSLGIAPLLVKAIFERIVEINREQGLTILLVTHDTAEALLLADRIAVLRAGEIVAIDTPHALLNSADPYVRRLFDTPRRRADAIEALARSAPANTGEGVR